MFLIEPPAVREASVFSALPASWRRNDPTNAWAHANRGGATIHSFLEGPVWADGHLWVTDIPYGRIFRISMQGEWDLVVEYDGEPNGMKRLANGDFLITDYRNGLMRLDTRSGSVTPFLERRNSERFRGVNDLTFDRTATCISRTRAKLVCTIRPDAFIAWRPTANSMCCWTTRPARTAWCCRPTRKCCSSP